MALVSSTTVVLASVALMLLAAVDKRRLVFGGERRCRHCHRAVTTCSCPKRRRGRAA